MTSIYGWIEVAWQKLSEINFLTNQASPDENKTSFERLSTSRIWWSVEWNKISKNAKSSFEISMFQIEMSFIPPINLFRTVVFQYKSEVRIKIRAILVGIIDF